MNYITKNNNGHAYASTYVREWEDGTVDMVSYATTVISIDPTGWLHCTGLYSMTTIKHIGWFMRERGFTYQLAKQLYNDGKEFNIYTGEIRDRG